MNFDTLFYGQSSLSGFFYGDRTMAAVEIALSLTSLRDLFTTREIAS